MGLFGGGNSSSSSSSTSNTNAFNQTNTLIGGSGSGGLLSNTGTFSTSDTTSTSDVGLSGSDVIGILDAAANIFHGSGPSGNYDGSPHQSNNGGGATASGPFSSALNLSSTTAVVAALAVLAAYWILKR